MVEKRGLKIPIKYSKLTTAQSEVLHLITDEFLTPKQIAQRRHTSLQAYYKITAQIKKKGFLDAGLNKVEKVETTYNQTDVRLHGQEFNIRIIWQDSNYQRKLSKSNILFIDSNSIRLYKNSIEVYSGQSFIGKTEIEADTKSLEYFKRFWARLEHELNICILKDKSRNIREVNHHFARGDSEICDNAAKNRERLFIYAEEDGKLAFITDYSFGISEDETVHPITAKPDRKAIDKQVNDWRLRNPPTNSELANFTAQNSQGLKILIDSVNSINNQQKSLPIVLKRLEKQINSHLKLIKEYRKENKSWRKGKEKEYKINLSNNQTKLNKWI